MVLFWNVGGKTHKGVVIGTAAPPKTGDEFAFDGIFLFYLYLYLYLFSFIEETNGFFNNDFRYDSDSEEQSIIFAGSYQMPASFNTPYATSPAVNSLE